MSDAWIAAFVLLALLNISTAVLLVSVMRQVGLLHQRLASGEFGESPPRAGSLVDRLHLTHIPGTPEEDPFQASVTIFAYVLPGCSGCEDIPSVIHAASEAGHRDGVQVVLATDANIEAAERYAVSHKVQIPFVSNAKFARHFAISGSPYFVAVRKEEDQLRLVAGAIVKSPKDLVELIEFAAGQTEDAEALAAELTVERRSSTIVESSFERQGVGG